ncbi:MAG: hypothetical protein AUK47_22910 [Deltaproteobacteria bacterium CG2_30_63_29]|nr:MAG: hypothetical protein AUK47_22910 [Deltaproteobacteria bacterium CG2_30_63_29]PIW02661.1 MAG: hypothetical protein COW42_00430 [Deltaproteobacteria bacterium CG17_big_fil_post_rev_8_21_14_2_50_63_7]PJB37494.1 MAG: hypothetical protein CO108_20975 [Deltaproteobacteria bacterium CG_4_9_14_3_um_filter_63_12]
MLVNLINRVVVCLVLATLVVCSILVLLYLLGFSPFEHTSLARSLQVPLENLGELQGAEWWSTILLLVLAGVGFAFLLALELRPNRLAHQPFLVEETELGLVTVEQRSVIQLVEQAVRTLPQVRHVKVSVYYALGGIRLKCSVSAMPSAVLTELGKAVQALAKERVQTQLGLQVIEVLTRMDFDAFRVERRVLD